MVALQFGAANRTVNLGSTAWSPATTFSFCGWFMPANFTTDGQSIFFKGSLDATASIVFSCNITLSNGLPMPQANLKVNGTTRTLTPTSPIAHLIANVEYFISVIYNGSTIKMYLNCVEIASFSTTGSVTVTSDASHIGSVLGNTKIFSGVIDDIRMYSRALSLSEMQTIYFSDKKDEIFNDLVGRWCLSEGSVGSSASGATIIDCSGRWAPGTASGNPVYADPLTPYWQLYAELKPNMRMWLECTASAGVPHTNNSGRVGRWLRHVAGYVDETHLWWNLEQYQGVTILKSYVDFVANTKGVQVLGANTWMSLQNKLSQEYWISGNYSYFTFPGTSWDTKIEMIAGSYPDMGASTTGTHAFKDLGHSMRNVVQGWVNDPVSNWGVIIENELNDGGSWVSCDDANLRFFYR